MIFNTYKNSYSQIIILITFLFLLSISQIFSQEQSITGIVRDFQKKEPIIGANAFITCTGKIATGTSTDILGRFKITNLVNAK